MWPLHFVLAMMSLLVTSSWGYPKGVPNSVCNSMFPHHGAEPQTTPPPYSITLDRSVYTPGATQTPIKVTVKSASTAFKGLFVQARSISDCNQTVGAFQLDPSQGGLKLRSCRQDNDSVCHSNSDVRVETSFLWIPPATGVGHVYFRATVVQATEYFWNTVQSDIVFQDSNNVVTRNTCQPPPTMENAVILDAISSQDNENNNDDNDDSKESESSNDSSTSTGGDNGGTSFSLSRVLMASLFSAVFLLKRLLSA